MPRFALDGGNGILFFRLRSKKYQEEFKTMTQKRKKGRERFHFDIVKQQVEEFPVGDVIEGERPDFVVRGANGTVGFEVTQQYMKAAGGGQSLRAQESEKSIVVEMARKLYEQLKLPPLEVHFLFGNSGPFEKSKRELLSTQLARLVQSHIPPSGTAVSIGNDFSERSDMPDEIAYVSIGSFDSVTHNHWSAGDSGFVQEDFIEELQHTIDGKNATIESYCDKCDSCWLIIVADGSGPSSFFQPSEKTIAHVYDSKFDRTYFVEAFTRRVVRLATVAIGGQSTTSHA
jgi:hypothetical protein